MAGSSERPASFSRPVRSAADEALDILVLLLSGEATVDDAASIRAWRKQGPAHEAAFAAAVRLWRGLAGAATRSRGVS